MSLEQEVKKYKHAMAQQFMSATQVKVIEGAAKTCYEKCVSNAGSSLTSYDADCVKGCVDKYIAIQQDVLQRLHAKAQEGAASGSSGIPSA